MNVLVAIDGAPTAHVPPVLHQLMAQVHLASARDCASLARVLARRRP